MQWIRNATPATKVYPSSDLAAKLRGKPDVRMIAVFPGAESEARQYAQQSQINVDTIFGLDLKLLQLRAIPAMILIDNNGMVLDFWIGKTSEDTERRVLNSL